MADSNIEGNTTRTFNDAINASQAKLVEIFAGLSIFLAISSSVGNFVILSALYRVSSIYPPTKLFFRCLAATDLCVGLIVQPLYTTSIMSYAMEMNENVSYYTGKICATSSTILCGVSLLTTTVISVDRLLALLLGLRYRTFVTLRRARFVNLYLDYDGYNCHDWVVESGCLQQSDLSHDSAFTDYFDVLLCKNLPDPKKASNSNTKGLHPWTTIRSRICSEHSKIQKNNVQHFVGAASVTCLLCPLWHCGWNENKHFSVLFGFVRSSPLQLNSKPDPVLLEDQRSEKSSEGYDPTATQLLKRTLWIDTWLRRKSFGGVWYRNRP